MAQTAARVDMVTSTNATWEDAFVFGTVGDTSWSFTGQHFLADIKGNRDDTVPVLSLSSAGGTIVVDDSALRTLHFHVDDSLVPAVGEYVYDLVMVDNGTGDRILLMSGKVCVEQGVTTS